MPNPIELEEKLSLAEAFKIVAYTKVRIFPVDSMLDGFAYDANPMNVYTKKDCIFKLADVPGLRDHKFNRLYQPYIVEGIPMGGFHMQFLLPAATFFESTQINKIGVSVHDVWFRLKDGLKPFQYTVHYLLNNVQFESSRKK